VSGGLYLSWGETQRRFARFFLTGGFNAGTCVLFGSLATLAFRSPALSFVIGYGLSLTLSYFVNARFVFLVDELSVRQFARFCVSYLPNFMIQLVVVNVLIQKLEVAPVLAFSLAVAVAVPLTFVLLTVFAFKQRSALYRLASRGPSRSNAAQIASFTPTGHTESAVLASSTRSPAWHVRSVDLLSRFTGVILATVILCVCVAQTLLGTMPTRIYSHDLFIFIDGAWRVASGQTPHQDFFSGFGVLLLKPLQLSLSIRGYDVAGIGLARAFYTAVVGLWTFLLIRRRLSPVHALLVTLASLAVVSAARPLGESLGMFSHSMYYNRVGYALVFLVMLEALYVSSSWRPASATAPFDRLWGGISTGAAIICLALLKVSFVVPAIVLLVTGAVLCGTSRRHLLGIGVGGLLVVVVAVLFLDFRPAPWLSDMVQLGRARSESPVEAMRGVVRHEAATLVAFLAAAICTASIVARSTAVARRYLTATVIIAGADLYCLATNTQTSDLPLSVFWCVLGLLLVTSRLTTAESEYAPPRWYVAAGAAIALFCVLSVPLLGKDAMSLADAAYVSTIKRPVGAPRIDSVRLSSWKIEDWHGDAQFDYANGRQLVAITDDGLQLLRRLTVPDESIGSLSFTNRFSFALGRPPAQGGAPWVHVGNNFSLKHPPPVEEILGKPDVLMVQRFASPPDGSLSLLKVYPSVLESDYERVGSSRYWTLYRRTKR
jgi:putative flippase GtrA